MRVCLACFFWRVFLMLGEFSPGLVDILQLDRFVFPRLMQQCSRVCVVCALMKMQHQL